MAALPSTSTTIESSATDLQYPGKPRRPFDGQISIPQTPARLPKALEMRGAA